MINLISCCVIALRAGILSMTATAHNIAFEDEVFACAVAPQGCIGEDFEPNGPGDSSFAFPQIQPVQRDDGIYNIYGPGNSQAIVGHLSTDDDFDVYRYEVTTADLQVSGGLLLYSVLPEVCEQNEDVHYSYAIVADEGVLAPVGLAGPFGPPEEPFKPTQYGHLPQRLRKELIDNDLKGKVVLYAKDQEPDIPGTRNAYVLENGATAYYLPYGCIQAGDEVDCALNSKNIVTKAVAEGEILFVVFLEGQEGTRFDYTLNVGLSEDNTSRVQPQKKYSEILGSGKHLLTECEEVN